MNEILQAFFSALGRGFFGGPALPAPPPPKRQSTRRRTTKKASSRRVRKINAAVAPGATKKWRPLAMSPEMRKLKALLST